MKGEDVRVEKWKRRPFQDHTELWMRPAAGRVSETRAKKGAPVSCSPSIHPSSFPSSSFTFTFTFHFVLPHLLRSNPFNPVFHLINLHPGHRFPPRSPCRAYQARSPIQNIVSPLIRHVLASTLTVSVTSFGFFPIAQAPVIAEYRAKTIIISPNLPRPTIFPST